MTDVVNDRMNEDSGTSARQMHRICREKALAHGSPVPCIATVHKVMQQTRKPVCEIIPRALTDTNKAEQRVLLI